MRFTNLQIGRFVAAMLVVSWHAIYYARDILGVDGPLFAPLPAYLCRTSIIFFFAVSGFVLAHSARTVSLHAFVGNRLLRLYPPLWAACAVVLLWRGTGWAVVPHEWDWLKLLKGLTLWPGGPHKVTYPLMVEWTLAYELYLLLGMAVLMMFGRRWGLGVGAAVWLTAIVVKQVVSPAPNEPFPTMPKLDEWPLAFPNAPFLMGILAYLTFDVWAGYRKPLLIAAAVPFCAGAACVETSLGWTYLLQSLGTVMILGWLAAARQVDEKNPLVGWGDWTYGIYLVHAVVIFHFYHWARTTDLFPPSAGTALFGAAVAVAVGSAVGALEWGFYRSARRWLRGGKRPTGPPATSPLGGIELRKAA